METSKVLNSYNKLIFNLQKYYDFINHNPQEIKALVTIPSELFKLFKVIVVSNGYLLDSTPLLEHISRKYDLETQPKDFKTRIDNASHKQLFKEVPELVPIFKIWYEQNKDSHPNEIKKVTQYYANLNREKNIIEPRLAKASNPKKIDHYRKRLNFIAKETSVSLKDKLYYTYFKIFHLEVIRDLFLYFAFKAHRNIRIDESILVNNDFVYHYLAQLIYNNYQKYELTEEQKNKLSSYLTSYVDNVQNQINEDGTITLNNSQKTCTININNILEFINKPKKLS